MMSVITDLMSSVSTVPSLDEEVRAWFDHDPGIQARPFDLYRRLRSEAPVYRAEDRILVTGYPEARSILTAPGTLQGISAKGSRYRTASERLDAEHRLELAQTFGFFEKRLGGSNGEHHTRLRKLAQRAFTPAWSPSWSSASRGSPPICSTRWSAATRSSSSATSPTTSR